MLPVTRVLRFLATLFFSTVLLASNAERRASPYITPESVPPQLLAAPPTEGSKDWQKQIDGVLASQKNISAEELTAIRDEQHVRISLMTGVIGKDFTPERFPKTFAMAENVFEDAEDISGADKKFWHTRRPYLTDPRVKLLIDPIDKSPSYPSGHSSSSHILAEVLGSLYPDKLGALRARAAAIAQHRVEAGVHYPIDIKAGEVLASLIVAMLMKNQDFLYDLAAARQEIVHPG